MFSTIIILFSVFKLKPSMFQIYKTQGASDLITIQKIHYQLCWQFEWSMIDLPINVVMAAIVPQFEGILRDGTCRKVPAARRSGLDGSFRGGCQQALLTDSRRSLPTGGRALWNYCAAFCRSQMQ